MPYLPSTDNSAALLARASSRGRATAGGMDATEGFTKDLETHSKGRRDENNRHPGDAIHAGDRLSLGKGTEENEDQAGEEEFHGLLERGNAGAVRICVAHSRFFRGEARLGLENPSRRLAALL